MRKSNVDLPFILRFHVGAAPVEGRRPRQQLSLRQHSTVVAQAPAVIRPRFAPQ